VIFDINEWFPVDECPSGNEMKRIFFLFLFCAFFWGESDFSEKNVRGKIRGVGITHKTPCCDLIGREEHLGENRTSERQTHQTPSCDLTGRKNDQMITSNPCRLLIGRILCFEIERALTTHQTIKKQRIRHPMRMKLRRPWVFCDVSTFWWDVTILTAFALNFATGP